MKTFLVFGISIAIVFYFGYSYGSTKTDLKYTNQLNAYYEKLDKLNEYIRTKEYEYNQQVSNLQSNISKITADYEAKLAGSNKLLSDRLQLSDKRAQSYREQVKTCSIESRDLAEHAARLDKKLTEGLSVVEELRELIKLRDNQLRALGKQLQLDRELVNDRTGNTSKAIN